MYTNQIEKYLADHIHDDSATVFVTSIDKLPTKPTYPLYGVINEDTSNNPGSHWVCLHINKSGESKKTKNINDFKVDLVE